MLLIPKYAKPTYIIWQNINKSQSEFDLVLLSDSGLSIMWRFIKEVPYENH